VKKFVKNGEKENNLNVRNINRANELEVSDYEGIDPLQKRKINF